MTSQPQKPWYKSKTLWFNAAAGTLAAAEANIHILQPMLGDQAYPILMMSVVIGNAILRVITTQGLSAGGHA